MLGRRWLVPGGGCSTAWCVAGRCGRAGGESRVSAFLIEANVPELFFCRDLKGYDVVRKGEYFNVGLAVRSGRSLPERRLICRVPRGQPQDRTMFHA